MTDQKAARETNAPPLTLRAPISVKQTNKEDMYMITKGGCEEQETPARNAGAEVISSSPSESNKPVELKQA